MPRKNTLLFLCMISASAFFARLVAGEMVGRQRVVLSFGSSLRSLPDVRFYYCGKILEGERQGSDSLVFYLPQNQEPEKLSMLFTTSLSPVVKQNGNTLDYFTIPEDHRYLFFTLQYQCDSRGDQRESELNPCTKNSEKKQSKFTPTYILEQTELAQRLVPRDALIILLDPLSILDISWDGKQVLIAGKNPFDSEEEFHKKAACLLLEAINLDLFHGHPRAHEKVKIAQGGKHVLLITS